MSAAAEANTPGAWPAAVRLIARWLDRHERVDALLETLPASLAGPERARCQNLVFGVVRHFGRLDAALARLVAHPPRFLTRAILFVAGYELIEAAGAPAAEGRAAKIGHHAVEHAKSIASPAEARLVNAVARKLAAALTAPAPRADASDATLGEYFSHPAWLVTSWRAQFGGEATRALLEWNQQPAPVHARWRAKGGTPPEFLRPTPWEGFFEVPPGHWSEIEPLLKAGALYLQDPSTRLPVELLAPQPDEVVLDLCAAPGGKSLLIADRIERGRIVAVDLPADAAKPDRRIERLKENLARAGAVEVALVLGDVLGNLASVLREHRLPADFPAVLIDVPCSNTGVMRHRVDVKWRLQPGDFKKHPQQQLSMLHAAARFVAPGGRLVYSTCSIDTEENEHVVRAFLAGRAGESFQLETSRLSFPWTSGHDGGAAFLLRKR
jgi:16S rRNA (cytosine967-C5)-methyltransferase